MSRSTLSDMRDDTIVLLLSLYCNKNLPVEGQARAIRKCAKTIAQRTRDKALKQACKGLRRSKNDYLVVAGIEQAAYKFFLSK
ncbi:hypothetical protein J7384_17250 [Endozoicomonas sp. G2_1]|uniref:DUF7740 domain-containing protein n=1 Tax=Endozoicomonas sp. G2_1 TaxID=2821091 RepID=UPI001AD9D104|nr:hypothetical protein [Endozoicomonas sp. G2_1]MBO9492112.1 hypothetical protein [Endozoicomonas sp. G2_1]